MGGNSRAINVLTGEVRTFRGRKAFAEQVDLRVTGVKRFSDAVWDVLSGVSVAFYSQTSQRLWLTSIKRHPFGVALGSSAWLFSEGTRHNLAQVKPLVGDVDIAIPEQHLDELFSVLRDLEGQELGQGWTYVGQNRKKLRKPSINAVFHWNDTFVQIDFVGVKFFQTGIVDPFVSFAHSSPWEDLEAGIKGVAHKYLLQTLAWAISSDDNIVVLTDKSSLLPGSVRLKTMHEPPRLMSFSVDRGLRHRLEQQFLADGTPLIVDGKNAYKELPTSQSSYTTDLTSIFVVMFGKLPNETDMHDFESFHGLLRLCRRYLQPNTYKRAAEDMVRYKLFGPGQALSRDSAIADRQVKERICEVLERETGVKIDCNVVNEYYARYNEREVSE